MKPPVQETLEQVKACLCAKKGAKQDLEDDYVSIDGLDFFPREFCKENYLEMRERRKNLQIQKLSSPPKPGKSPNKGKSPLQGEREDQNIAMYAHIF